jgi:hypothetical protein
MEIEAARLKDALPFMFQKELETELNAHRIVLETIKIKSAMDRLDGVQQRAWALSK